MILRIFCEFLQVRWLFLDDDDFLGLRVKLRLGVGGVYKDKKKKGDQIKRNEGFSESSTVKHLVKVCQWIYQTQAVRIVLL
jgi:hypothetical protein